MLKVSRRRVLAVALLLAAMTTLPAGASTVLHMGLSDLAQRDAEATNVRSDLFSRSVIRHMGTKTSFRAKPHRTAAFKVLKTHLVPSVLIELAYVTNKADAARLKSDKWRNKVSDGIATAIGLFPTTRSAPPGAGIRGRVLHIAIPTQPAAVACSTKRRAVPKWNP